MGSRPGGAYILARLWAGRMFKHLAVSRTMLERAFPGEQVAVTLTFKNLSYLPVPWLLFNEAMPVGSHIASGAKIRLPWPRPRFCGRLLF